MSSANIFIIVLVVILITGGIQIYGTYSRVKSENHMDGKLTELSANTRQTNESLKEISWNLMLLRNGNNNNLTLSSARDVSHAILDASKYRIKEDVLSIIERNHIDDTLRQKLITTSLSAKINGYYTTDYNSVSRLYYKNKQLSDIWIMFDVNSLTTGVLNMMFDKNYTNDHSLLKSDVQGFIDESFSCYYSTVDSYLEKID
jgi:hypothetical protein